MALEICSEATAHSLAVTGAAIRIAESAGTNQLGVRRKSCRRRCCSCRRRDLQLPVMVSILHCRSHRNKQLSGKQACQQQAASCGCHHVPLQHHAGLGRHSSVVRLIFQVKPVYGCKRRERENSQRKRKLCIHLSKREKKTEGALGSKLQITVQCSSRFTASNNYCSLWKRTAVAAPIYKGYLDRYHCNFQSFKNYHYYLTILNLTIIALLFFEICHCICVLGPPAPSCLFLSFCMDLGPPADVYCVIVFLYGQNCPSTFLSLPVFICH